MDYLGHALINANDDVDFDSQEDFAESVRAYVGSAARGSGLLYPSGRGNNFDPKLEKRILDNDEAIVFFSSTKSKMIHCLKSWESLAHGHTGILCKRQLAIVCGSYDGGKKTKVGTFLTGQSATISNNLKVMSGNFKIFKKRLKLKDPSFEKKAEYSLKDAERDSAMHNFLNNFFYCYVGMPKFGPIGVDMTVLVNHAITPSGLAAWLKDGKGATKI